MGHRPVHRSWKEWLSEPPLISIVDDDDLFRRAVEHLVRSFGFATRTFASAESFLQSSQVKQTRCLITDLQMPNMSGLELREQLARLGFDIPIIFITAYPNDSIKAQALNVGAVCYLHKPLDLLGRRLFDCLQEALGRGGMPPSSTE